MMDCINGIAYAALAFFVFATLTLLGYVLREREFHALMHEDDEPVTMPDVITSAEEVLETYCRDHPRML